MLEALNKNKTTNKQTIKQADKKQHVCVCVCYNCLLSTYW